MVIYLKHPKHGTKVATSDLEAAYDEANGWERYTIEQPEVNSPGSPGTEEHSPGTGEPENVVPMPPAKRKYTRRA